MLTNNGIYGRNATLETLNAYRESYKLIENVIKLQKTINQVTNHVVLC